MQVDPTKPILKAPKTKRLKLNYDGPPSNFAFKIILRRYTEARGALANHPGADSSHAAELEQRRERAEADVRAAQEKVDVLSGRGLHSSTIQLNLSRF